MSAVKEIGNCRTCQAAVFWLKNTKTGRTAPIDQEPGPRGNCRIDLSAGTYTVFAGEQLAVVRAKGEELRTNHFMTCPEPPPKSNPRRAHVAIS